MQLDIGKVVKEGFEKGLQECELTIGMTLKEAVEKQIPKKPNIPWDTQLEQCPMCQRGFIGQPSYCSVCGQKIDWRDET